MDSLVCIARAFAGRDDDILSIVAPSALGPRTPSHRRDTRFKNRMPSIKETPNCDLEKTRDVGVQATPRLKRGVRFETFCRAKSDPFPTWWTIKNESPRAVATVAKPKQLELVSAGSDSSVCAYTPKKSGQSWAHQIARRRKETLRIKTQIYEEKLQLIKRKTEKIALLNSFDPNFVQCARSCFMAFDFDGSGTLNKNELRCLIRKMKKETLGGANLEDLLIEMDKDNSGEVDEDEFVFYMAKKHEQEEASNESSIFYDSECEFPMIDSEQSYESDPIGSAFPAPPK